MSNSSKEPMPVPLEATPAWIEAQKFTNDMFVKFVNNLMLGYQMRPNISRTSHPTKIF